MVQAPKKKKNLGSAEYGVPPYKNKAAIFVSLLSGNVLRKLSENVWAGAGGFRGWTVLLRRPESGAAPRGGQDGMSEKSKKAKFSLVRPSF